VCSTSVKAPTPPSQRGLAANSLSVVATQRISVSYTQRACTAASALSSCGSVNTRCAYGTFSSSASRAARHASRSRVWHCGQCRLRHECQRHCSAPHPSQRRRWPPSAAVRQPTTARQARACALLSVCAAQ